MHPVLFHLGGFEVPSYGVALSLAFIVGFLVARRRAIARGIDDERLLDVSLVIFFTSLLGARLLWVATHRELFQPPHGAWVDALNPFRGRGLFGFEGLSMLGGVVLATGSALAFMAWRRMPVLATADVIAPSVALGEGITRIGCFLNGCCYGVPCSAWYCVHFPGVGESSVHPTQLYASAAGFACFALLSRVLRHPPFPGAVFALLLVLEGFERVLLDLVRHQDASVVWFRLGEAPFTANQGVSIGLVIAGAIAFATLSRRL